MVVRVHDIEHNMTSIIDDFYFTLQRGESLSALVNEDIILNAAYPIEQIIGINAIEKDFWQLFKNAFEHFERKAFIEFDSVYEDDRWIAATGYFSGIFVNDFLGIPATGNLLYLRFTELVKITNDRISEYFIIFDFLDVMHQVGIYPLRKSLGHCGQILPPTTMDGLSPVEVNKFQAAESEQLVLNMLDELGKFDGKSLLSMQLDKYWHPDFMWYGPAGIGTTKGIKSFREHHQGPFVFSFPDRAVDHKACVVKKGNYVATGGWPHMHGTHSAGGWLGLPPTNKKLELRVIDIWRREGNLLKENWVGIDIIHMCKQMGLDVFALMKTSV
jgi:predicted ester cyclase